MSADDNVSASITYDVTIDGDGHTLTSTATRGFWIDENNITASIKNLKLVGKDNVTQRGIQVNGGMKGITLSVDNVELANMSYYAVNICNDVTVDLSITNSKITGWGAINLWSAKYNVYIANSELNGVNDKTYNAAGWNDFGTLVLEGDTTGATTEGSSELNVKVVNTKITGSQTKGNRQYLVLFNDNSAANIVNLNGCTFEYTDGDRNSFCLDQGTGNKLYVDGVLKNA